MTTTLLRKALLDYIDRTVVTEEERNSIDAAIVELDEIEQRAGTDDTWEQEVYMMHAGTVSDLMNVATYGIYSDVYAVLKDLTDYTDYEHAVLTNYPTLTTAAVELGYDIVRDLHADSKQRKSLLHTLLACLDRLQATYDCNHEVMDVDDLGDLLTTMEDLKYYINKYN